MKPKLRIPKGWRRMKPGEMLDDNDSWIDPTRPEEIIRASMAISKHLKILSSGSAYQYPAADFIFITQRKPLK